MRDHHTALPSGDPPCAPINTAQHLPPSVREELVSHCLWIPPTGRKAEVTKNYPSLQNCRCRRGHRGGNAELKFAVVPGCLSRAMILAVLQGSNNPSLGADSPQSAGQTTRPSHPTAAPWGQARASVSQPGEIENSRSTNRPGRELELG